MAKRFLFQRLLKEGIEEGFQPGQTQEAKEWFRDKAAQLKDVRPDRLMTRPGAKKVAYFWRPGEMYLFQYRPKEYLTPKQPYHDRFPLIMLLNQHSGGWFEGINFHYLPYEFRAQLLDRMYRFRNSDDVMNTNYRLQTLTWHKLIRRFGGKELHTPCIKRYINNNVRGRFIKIHPAEWDLAIMLPIERFRGASRNKIWMKSRELFQ
jgi:hypothetical protein